MAYLTLDQAQRELGELFVVGDDATLSDLIARVTDEINQYCRRRFEPITATRYYGLEYPGLYGGHTLYLDDDLLTLTALVGADDYSWTIPPAANTGYHLLPRNNPPYQVIKLLMSPRSVFTFNTDHEIAVTGTWGYSAVCPPTVRQACLDTVQAWYSSLGIDPTITNKKSDDVTVTYSRASERGLTERSLTLLAPFRRPGSLT